MATETDTLYTKEEVIAYATWATSAMLSKSSIATEDKNNILSKFEKEVSGLVEYDKKERNSISVMNDIKSKIELSTKESKSSGLVNHKCGKIRS